MDSFTLNIADYFIRFESAGLLISPSKRYYNYIAAGTYSRSHRLLITVHEGLPPEKEGGLRIFHAPFVVESCGLKIVHDPEFWSVWKNDSGLWIRVVFPDSDGTRKAFLSFSLQSNEWDLWIENPGIPADPFEYPLDGLILYYLTAMHNDIMIHASGINLDGKGYLFSGISGRGKTTISRIFAGHGSELIHDDRLIIRKTAGGYTMYNTPVYEDDYPQESWVDAIYLIDHGTENSLAPVYGANAVSQVMSNCIQHNWGHEIITGLLGSVSELCRKVSISKLSFIPDAGIVEFIQKNG